MELNPGNKVTCTLHPQLGVGTLTYRSNETGKGFIVWGEFGKMLDRKYEHCQLTEIIKHESSST
jgi:hypothetical protein